MKTKTAATMQTKRTGIAKRIGEALFWATRH